MEGIVIYLQTERLIDYVIYNQVVGTPRKLKRQRACAGTPVFLYNLQTNLVEGLGFVEELYGDVQMLRNRGVEPDILERYFGKSGITLKSTFKIPPMNLSCLGLTKTYRPFTLPDGNLLDITYLPESDVNILRKRLHHATH